LKWEPAGPGETPSPRGRVKKPQKKEPLGFEFRPAGGD
jgi:hypothetical protein